MSTPRGYEPGWWSSFSAELAHLGENARLGRPGVLASAIQSFTEEHTKARENARLSQPGVLEREMADLLMATAMPLVFSAVRLAAEPLPPDPGERPRRNLAADASVALLVERQNERARSLAAAATRRWGPRLRLHAPWPPPRRARLARPRSLRFTAEVVGGRVVVRPEREP